MVMAQWRMADLTRPLQRTSEVEVAQMSLMMRESGCGMAIQIHHGEAMEVSGLEMMMESGHRKVMESGGEAMESCHGTEIVPEESYCQEVVRSCPEG
jgi:hypothetical protein